MASLILNGDTLRVNLVSKRVEVMQRIYDKNGERQVTSQVPLYAIERVVVVGRPTVTLPVLTRFLDEGIPCFFVTRYGRWRGVCCRTNRTLAAVFASMSAAAGELPWVGATADLCQNSQFAKSAAKVGRQSRCSSAPEQVSRHD